MRKMKEMYWFVWWEPSSMLYFFFTRINVNNSVVIYLNGFTSPPRLRPSFLFGLSCYAARCIWCANNYQSSVANCLFANGCAKSNEWVRMEKKQHTKANERARVRSPKQNTRRRQKFTSHTTMQTNNGPQKSSLSKRDARCFRHFQVAPYGWE